MKLEQLDPPIDWTTAVLGTIILYPRGHEESEAEIADESSAVGCAI